MTTQRASTGSMDAVMIEGAPTGDVAHSTPGDNVALGIGPPGIIP
jgi:hypothetical protein